MSENSTHSVTLWIDQLKAGNSEAVDELWDRYFAGLVGVARHKLGNASRRVADEEDVAISAFYALCEGVDAGRFENLNNREDLWSLLVAIAGKKAVDSIRRQTAAKRGGGEVRGNSIFQSIQPNGENGFEFVMGEEPSPEFLAQIGEEHKRLLGLLRDDHQREIVQLRLAGHQNAAIADMIGISVRSVERKLRVIRDTWSGELHV